MITVETTARLPAAYQEAEYIQSNGEPYIKLEYKPNEKTIIKAKIGANNGNFFAASSSAAKRFGIYALQNGKFDIAFGGSGYVGSVVTGITYPAEIIFRNGSITVNGTVGNFATQGAFTTTTNLSLFAEGTSASSGEIYYWQIYENESLLYDLVPCYRISDNVAGLYDLVNNVFYTNAGSGAFTVGPATDGGKVIVITPGGAVPQKYALRRRMMSAGTIKLDENTLLLLHGEDLTDGSIYGHTVTNSGVTASSAQSKFGGKSLYFNGSSRLVIPYNSMFDFGTGDFTVDMWVNPAPSSADNCFIGSSKAGAFFFGRRYGNSTIGVGRVGIAWDNQITSTLQVNTWNHLAVVRSQGTLMVFVNGALIGSAGNTNSYSFLNAQMVIGAEGTGSYFEGYIDEFRISNIARWTENFTPPTKPY